MEVTVVDEDGVAVADGTVGRIRVRGPCVMRGYWRDPELTAAALDATAGCVSGDLGFLTAEGNLRLVGRIGRHVHPRRLQRATRSRSRTSSPSTRRSTRLRCSVGPPPVIGEIGVAFVVPARPVATRRRWTSCAPGCATGWPTTRRPTARTARRAAADRRCSRPIATPCGGASDRPRAAQRGRVAGATRREAPATRPRGTNCGHAGTSAQAQTGCTGLVDVGREDLAELVRVPALAAVVWRRRSVPAAHHLIGSRRSRGSPGR